MKFEAYLEQQMQKAAQKQELLGKHMHALLSSEVGQSLLDLINGLVSNLKDEHVFGEFGDIEATRRTEIKGSIHAYNVLMSVLLELARENLTQETGAVQPWATPDYDDEDNSIGGPVETPTEERKGPGLSEEGDSWEDDSYVGGPI